MAGRLGQHDDDAVLLAHRDQPVVQAALEDRVVRSAGAVVTMQILQGQNDVTVGVTDANGFSPIFRSRSLRRSQVITIFAEKEVCCSPILFLYL